MNHQASGLVEQELRKLSGLLLHLKGYSSPEGNRIVKAAIVATEAIAAGSTSRYCSQAGDLDQHEHHELLMLNKRLLQLQDSPQRSCREEETLLLHEVMRTLDRLAAKGARQRCESVSERTDDLASPGTPEACGTAVASGGESDHEGPGGGHDAQQQKLGEEEAQEEDEDDPFNIPLPSAVKMAEANSFFLLAQPLAAAESESTALAIAIQLETEITTPPQKDRAVAHASPVKHDSSELSVEADNETVSTCATGGTRADMSPGPADSASNAPVAEPSAGKQDVQLQRLEEFLKGHNNSFHQKMALSLDGCGTMAKYLASGMHIKTLSLSNNHIGDQGVASLCKGLRVATTISVLNLPRNSITDVGAGELVSALSGNMALTALQLSDNKIGDVGTVSIAELIRKGSAFSKLGLAQNNIGQAGCQALCNAIAANNSFKHLQLLPGNKVPEKDAKLLYKALKRNNGFSLQHLLLGAAGTLSWAS